MLFRLLPWEYALRSLFRRPLRTLLTFAGLTTVVLLVLVVVGFVRGLEQSLAVSGDPDVALLHSNNMGKNLEYSSVPMRTGDLVAASVPGIRQRYGQKYVSGELYLGTEVRLAEDGPAAMGLVRGVTREVLLVRRQVELETGAWPGPGEVLVGRLAAAKIGAGADELAVGTTLYLEGRAWRVSGQFSAASAAFESEIWCRLDELQSAMKRQDLSIVALALGPEGRFGDVQMFCAEQPALELEARRETEYYASLQEDYHTVRYLAWLVVVLVGSAGVFTGLNTMYGAVLGRTRELATLQTIGFVRRAIVVSLLQEGLLLAAAASLTAALLAVLCLDGAAVRFTMGAFALRIDGVAVLLGCGVGLAVGLLGTIPPAARALRTPIVAGLRSV